MTQVETLAKVGANEAGSGYEEQMPPPPDTIVLPHGGYMDAEQEAYYNEDDARIYQTVGPESCPRYYQTCWCDKCKARDAWHLRKR